MLRKRTGESGPVRRLRFPQIAVLILLMTSLTSPSPVADDFLGTVRVFVVEPTSRWSDCDGYDFGFGFLDFAVEEPLDLKELGAWEFSTQWDANLAGFENVTADNVVVIAVVYNSDSVLADALPPYGYYFYIHNVETAALALPGGFGIDQSEGGFTHTVFVELGVNTG